ncbi:MAG: YccF domain-containing protein [Chloroflexi bacterium]|nr:YccF domain-containing protein [Chloroflexota bacterium]MCI0578426.1 YccF domain-containing protein [Chloroflexota bacterium]MCI0644928.1 YccF domain-containing protein [Chloroflexota bacterium]MCI0731949.1 YccF domain-containing protein [Chloroflexota bacterium]
MKEDNEVSEAVMVSKVKHPVREIPFLLRVIWFFVLGWELAGAWILIAWALNATIIGLPLGLWMIDRVPQVLTLKARPGAWVVDLTSGRARFMAVRQPSWLIRLAYFVVIGWWFSLIWAAVAWVLCATIIGLPFGVLMLHALPAVTTLQRG